MSKDRTNVPLVVATIIVSAAFGAPHQMPPTAGNAWALRMFVICVTTAMHVALVAAIMLCWAQLVDVNIASLVAFIESAMVGFALYVICFAFLDAMVIGTRHDDTFLKVIVVIQAFYSPFPMILSIPLIIPFSLKELAIRCAYFLLFRCYFAVRNVKPRRANSI